MVIAVGIRILFQGKVFMAFYSGEYYKEPGGMQSARGMIFKVHQDPDPPLSFFELNVPLDRRECSVLKAGLSSDLSLSRGREKTYKDACIYPNLSDGEKRRESMKTLKT